MAIESVGGATQPIDLATQRLGLSQEDFLEVLLTQLSFQDPLDPLDNKDFIAQLAQFTTLDQSRQANDKLETLLSFQSVSQAIGLIGKTVEVRTDTGTVVGEVIASAFLGGVPSLNVRTEQGQFLTDIGLGQIVIVQ